MLPQEIQSIVAQAQLEDSEHESEESNNSQSNEDIYSNYSDEINHYSKFVEKDWSDEEYYEIMESTFNRYDIIHETYRTHKQDINIPKNYNQLIKMKDTNHEEYLKYVTAMEIEEANMIEQQVYLKKDIVDKVPLDNNGNVPRFIDSTWAYAKQYDEKGELIRYKARLCGRGFREIKGIDYEEVYSPTVKQKLGRAIVAISASNNWDLFQDDCKAAYLNAVLEKGKWLKLPNGKFVFIRKCLYGLKESAREWFKLVKSYLVSIGFKQNPADPCTFLKLNELGKLELVLALFVDDILSTGNPQSINDFREQFKKRFRVSDKGGVCKHFLSIRFSKGSDYIYLDQTTYINQKLQDYQEFLGNSLLGCASPLPQNFQEILLTAEQSKDTELSFPYREMVGSLVYAANGTRFDITAAVSIVSRFANNPKKIHCDMVRRIYQYLKANPKKLRFKLGGDIKLVGYCDASLGNLEDYSSVLN